MRPPPQLANEPQRLATLQGYELLDTAPEKALDDLTALAAHICGAPIALISLVDEQRQWFKSKVGTELCETPRDSSFCGHALQHSELTIIPDATRDDRFADNPLVTGEPRIRFYAGAPLVANDGHVLGTLCVIDHVPRELNAAQQAALRVLSQQVMAQVELRRQTRTLRESEAKLSAAFYASSVTFAIVTMQGQMVEVNPAFCELTGYSREEALGKTFSDLGLLTQGEREKLGAVIASAGGRGRDFELVFRNRHGVSRHVLFSIEEISLQGVPHRLGTGVDITARKQAEAKIALQSETLTTITASLAAYVECGDWSEAMGRLLRSALRQTGSEYGFIGVVVGGSLRVLSHEGVVWDEVLNRDLYEQALRRSEELGYLEFTDLDNLFSRAITTAQVVIANCPDSDPRSKGRPGGHPSMRSFLGVPIFAGQQVQGLVALANRPGGYTGEEQRQIETLVQHAGGLCSSYRQREAALVLDQERVRAETAKRETEERLRLAVRAAHVGLWDWNMVTNSVTYSTEWKHQLGHDEQEISNLFGEWVDRMHPDDLARVHAAIAGYVADPVGVYEIEYRLRHKDGNWRWFYARGEALRGENGQPYQMLGCQVDITERMQTEQSLRASEEKLRNVMDGLGPNILLGLLTTDGRLVEANRPALNAAGLTREDVLGKPVDETPWWSHSQGARERLRAAVARALTGTPSRYDEQICAKGDTLMWIDFSLHPVRDRNGLVMYVVLSGNAIDERVRAETAQRENVERFQAVARATNDAVWDWDLASGTLWWSENFHSLFGYTAEETEPGIESWTNRVHPQDRERVESGVHAVIEGSGNVWWEEYRFRRKDGTYAQIFDRGYVVRDRDGHAIRVVGTMQDITERNEAEQRLHRLNRTYVVLSEINQLIVRAREPQAILDGACKIAVEKGGFLLAWMGHAANSEQPLKFTAHAGVTTDSAEVLEQLFSGPPHGCGLTAQPFANGGHALCNDIEQDSRAVAWRDAALQRGYKAMVSLPLNVSGRQGGIFNLYADQKDFFDREELRLLDGLAMDLAFALEGCERDAERQRALEQFRASEERLRELAETVQEVFWITDPAKTQMLFVSAAYEKIWGRTCASLYSSPQDWLEAVHPEDRPRIEDAMRRKQAHGDYDETYRIIHSDGGERWIHERAFPVRDPAGQVLRVVGTAEDITNRRRLEEQLRQSQKMDAIGQLAGGVAHDFNNILTAMFMQVEISAMADDITPELRDGLKLIRSCAERAANLTRQLLLFSHKQVMQPRVLDLNDIVTSLAKMLQRLIEENVALELNLHPVPLFTQADASMVDQVLMNLAVNARDAMPGGGRLLITTTAEVVTKQLARTHPDAEPGNYVCLSVSDTGTGIEPHILPRIFEPFFTTKQQGKGTGLGLATVFGIVKQHRGWLSVASEVNRGTTVRIFLPASPSQPNEEAPPVNATQPRGKETILLVEDEPAVRQLTRLVLERAGYRVLEAPDGVEARMIGERNRGLIKLLFTDMVMPGGVSGRELATALQQSDPALRVIFTSGYSAEIAGRKFISDAGHNFIQKPSSAQQILETIRRCLDS